MCNIFILIFYTQTAVSSILKIVRGRFLTEPMKFKNYRFVQKTVFKLKTLDFAKDML